LATHGSNNSRLTHSGLQFLFYQVDYNFSFIKFLHDGKFITIFGDNSTIPKQAQFYHIKWLVNTNVIAKACTLQVEKPEESTKATLPLSTDMEPNLALLLHKYAKAFDQPLRLSQHREHDHNIPLIPGATPVNVRPYRCPHSQKEQIKLMVQQMLDEGII